jgi:hypothetical protein
MKFILLFLLCAVLRGSGQTVTTTQPSSTGGNGAADANKTAKFGTGGSLRAESLLSDTTLNVGGGTSGLLSGNPAATLTRTITGATAHGWADESTFSAGTSYDYNSYDAITQVNGRTSGSYTNHVAGFQSRLKLLNGTLVNYYGFSSLPEVAAGTASIGSLRQFYAGTPVIGSGSSITTSYGLQINDQKITGVTYGVGIAQDYNDNVNWLVGSTAIGYGSVPPSDAQLYVYPYAANMTAIRTANYSLTGSTAIPMVDLAGTWNTTGHAAGIKLNITNTASGSQSKLLQLQVGSADVYSIGKNGIPGFSGAAPTVASASTIAPVTQVAFISGTTTIATITAPEPVASKGGQITLIPTGLWATNTSGNIALGTTAVVSKALILTYDPTTAKWYPSY